mgnify:CR=1 FL=1
MYVCMGGWMDGWMDGCMYACMYGWMDGWVIHKFKNSCFSGKQIEYTSPIELLCLVLGETIFIYGLVFKENMYLHRYAGSRWMNAWKERTTARCFAGTALQF